MRSIILPAIVLIAATACGVTPVTGSAPGQTPFAVAMAQHHATAAVPLYSAETPASELQDFTHERLAAAVAPIAERALQEHGIVGFSIAIAHKGLPVYVSGFGMADLERQRPATGDTQYEIQSISKMFTAVAVLQLVEKALLDLDCAVSNYLPEYEGPLRDAPIRSLLNHTSGFQDGPFVDEATLPARTATFEEKMASSSLAQGNLAWPTGDHFRYSNASYNLVGLIIEAIVGKPFGEISRELIFDPVGMQRSTTGDFNHPEAAVYYLNRKDGEPTPAPGFNLSIADGAGSIISTPRELVAFQSALYDGRLLAPATLELMREPTEIRGNSDSVRVPFGLGIAHGPKGGRRKLGHQGTWSGSSVLAHYPDENMTITVLTNTNAGDSVHAMRLESWIAHAIFRDQSPVFSSTALPFDEEFAGLLTGRFQSASGSICEHRLEGGRLRVYVDGELTGRLLRVGPSATIFVPGDGELASRLTEGQTSNPPDVVAESSPNGDWIFVHVGGMFYDDFQRLEPEE